MSERTSYAPGTPCWIDLATPDHRAAAEFYGALFGWDVPEADENAEQTGGYRLAMLKGKAVGGVMPLMQEGQPPAWSDLRRGRGRRRDGGQGQGGRRQRDGRADGRDGPRPDGGLRRPDRRRLRRLAAGHVRRRRARQRARRPRLERAQHPRRRAAPRTSTAPSSAGPSRTRSSRRSAPTPRSSWARPPVGGMLDISGRVPDEVPPNWLDLLRRRGHRRHRGEGEGAGRRRQHGRDRHRPPAASPSSTIPFGAVFAVIAPNPTEGESA